MIIQHRLFLQLFVDVGSMRPKYNTSGGPKCWQKNVHNNFDVLNASIHLEHRDFDSKSVISWPLIEHVLTVAFCGHVCTQVLRSLCSTTKNSGSDDLLMPPGIRSNFFATS